MAIAVIYMCVISTSDIFSVLLLEIVMHTEELFKLFFRLLDPDMHPPRLYQRGDLEMFWRERFSEALGLQEPNGAMMGYVELPKIFLKTYRAVQEKMESSK